MAVGVIGWELEVVGSQSLKDKRRVVKSLKDRLHQRFNISVAETAHHELWQRAGLTACVAAADARHAERVLDEADRFVHSDPRARVIRAERSYV